MGCKMVSLKNIWLERAVNTISGQQQVKQRRLKSFRLIGESETLIFFLFHQLTDYNRYEKPWITNSPYKNRERWDKGILWGCIAIGFSIGAVLCYLAYERVPREQVSMGFPST
jgi:hypothetical protein